jgi:hypothetical protein
MRKRSPQDGQAVADRAGSPVVLVTRSQLTDLTRLLLFVRAGGHCEFDGCNRNVTEHHVTLTEGNFAEVAHIVAFKEAGPRGDDPQRPPDINDIANLMLLCPSCHKLIDDDPIRYTREKLEGYKQLHEDRIRHLTGLAPELKTCHVVVQTRIGDDSVAIPFNHVLEAVSPRYPIDRRGVVIDLTAIEENGSAFIEAACGTLQQRLRRVYDPQGEAAQSGHLSLFARAPIPVLVFLGTKLSNKVDLDLFQRHRGPENWTWQTGGAPVEYEFRTLRGGGARDKVVLVMSLSGTIRLEDLPPDVDEPYTVYELRPKIATPNAALLRSRADLEEFRIAYQQALGTIIRDHGLIPEIRLFPAVPAPVAVLCGRELLPKVHPALAVYDFDKKKGGFILQVKVNDYGQQ